MEKAPTRATGGPVPEPPLHPALDVRANLTFLFGGAFTDAVVRVAVLHEDRIISLGSGVIATPDGRVLTAAHILRPIQRYGLLLEEVRIAIGTYQSDESSTRWEYYAELVSPRQALFAKDRRRRFVDYAVLAIRGRLELRPAEFRGIGTVMTQHHRRRTAPVSLAALAAATAAAASQSIAGLVAAAASLTAAALATRGTCRWTEYIKYETIMFEPTPLTFDNFVRPAPPEALENILGVEVLVCGYPSPHGSGWTSISVSRGSICMVDGTGMLGVHAFIHDGSSGGPAFILHEGAHYVAGIVSHNPCCNEGPINNLACIRSVHASCLRSLPRLHAAVHA